MFDPFQDMNPPKAYMRRNANKNVELEVPRVLISYLAEKVTHLKF